MLSRNHSENKFTKGVLNTKVLQNHSRLNYRIFFLPVLLLVGIILFLYTQNAFSTEGYIQIQQKYFFIINEFLSRFPKTMFNLTQLGDTMVALSILSIFIIYTPQFWESLMSAFIVSALFSRILKFIFAVPRPAAVLDPDSFVIIGRTLKGHSSLPSGHSITIFTLLTVLMFTFMPKKLGYRILWIILILVIGVVLVFTRVGVGAHYPLDVIIGGMIGYISGILGIFINRKYKIWNWINQTQYYPLFLLLFFIFGIILIVKIYTDNLAVYYWALLALIVTLYKMFTIYVQKKH